ncbi:RING/U-box superfamily protein [Abeliophyllum distichum]|uniref:RING/U-box superfamily protein n=1 Tax=Abeliophyllum distichum TaxID=126358 RepID=A0ABD1TDX0_9LAMI
MGAFMIAYDYYYEDEDEDLYLGSSSSLRIGNRRWGDNGYVRTGRQEARPISRPNFQDSGAGPSRQTNNKEAAAKETVGRRAKWALKREAADKAAAAKHQQHLGSVRSHLRVKKHQCLRPPCVLYSISLHLFVE